jgi:PAP2 superfamily
VKARSLTAVLVMLLGTAAFVSVGPGAGASPQMQCAPGAAMPVAMTPVAFWSTEARCAIAPSGPGGLFGSENFGNKFPGEAAVYMGIVHIAIYDAAVAIEGGYRPYAIAVTMTSEAKLRTRTGWSAWAGWRLGQGDWKPYGKANRNVRPRVPRVIPRSWWARLAKFLSSAPADPSLEAAIAAATYDTLVGLQPTLRLDSAGQAILHDDYTAYLAAIPDGEGKANGIAVGEQVAEAVLAKRANDGLEKNPTPGDLNPPPPGPGVWQPAPAPAPVLGLRLPGVRPLALQSASQFRPDGPSALTSREYAEDFNEVKDLGRLDSTTRTAEQSIEARFWTDHDIRQWNDGMLRLAATRGLDLVQTARMLAMAHVAGGDAMIACFDAKYHYWFWRPYQAIPQAGSDGNPATEPDPSWKPLAATPNFPEYPSAHACHSTAVVAALDAFFGTDKVPFTLDSRVTHTTRAYERLQAVVKDVDLARVLVGFHFLNSDQQGSNLGRKVGRYVAKHLFQPLGGTNVKREQR